MCHSVLLGGSQDFFQISRISMGNTLSFFQKITDKIFYIDRTVGKIFVRRAAAIILPDELVVFVYTHAVCICEHIDAF